MLVQKDSVEATTPCFGVVKKFRQKGKRHLRQFTQYQQSHAQVKQRQHLHGLVHYTAEKTTALIDSVNGVHGSVANCHTGKTKEASC